ncbi:MAG: hypothetical protein BZ137_02685 [Methanosphaera sp. rholeuAM130]|nr:cation diffusion facilitator family transporter [Methanosphaera sp.]RAP54348.1 MAG: hypothetical protein BZ137_02685 [Methanosphaera sp. rholeuAM130]
MKNYHGEVKKVLMIGLTLNIIMATLKIAVGYYSGILSVTADGYDSFLDAVANIIAMLAVYLSARPMDKNHPYGYAKIENFASLVVGFSLLLVSYEVFTQAIDKFLHPQTIEVSSVAFVIIIATLLVNIGLSRYEKIKGEELKSDLLIADSSHTKGDVLVTSIVLTALVLMYFDLSFIDPVISIIITVIILKTAVDIFKTNFRILLDANMLETEKIEELISGVEGVVDVHNIRTRGTTSSVYVDMHIAVDSRLSVRKAHDISDRCEKIILNAMDEVKEVLIHIESDDH